MSANPFRRREREAPPADDDEDARNRRIFELAGAVTHGDPAQLAFQISEIAGDRVYTRHGIALNPGDTVIDAGGNFGVSAAHFALQCGAGTVHSFEPAPATFEILESNLAGIPACTAHPLGLSSVEGEAEFTYFAGGDSVMSGVDVDPGRVRELLATAGRNLGLSAEDAERMAEERLVPQTVTCRFTTISAFLEANGIERVDLLKIDVEGAELDVLEGIEDGDWGRIRQVAAEIHSDELLESADRLLTGRGFRFTVGQDPQLSGTPIHLVYAVR